MSFSVMFSLFFTILLANEIITCKSSSVSIIPDLPLGEINIVVLTDVHSWLAGHSRQEEALNADYGDVLSFYENLKAYSDANDRDLFIVSNGDFVDGTGLSIPGDPSSLIPALEKMPLDALTCGNHELYIDETVQDMVRPGGWVDWWGDKYLTGNIQVNVNGKSQQLGHLYRYLKGKHSNLLVYGFLYNMEGACESIIVQKVHDVVKLPWFKEALTPEDESVDAVLVLAHMDLKDPSVTVILKAIREISGDSMPIQFITGHTHYRGEMQLDDRSHSFEAGRYLDTVGFVSFPTKATAMSSLPSTNDGLVDNGFKHVFINANTETLAGHLGLKDPKDMDTEHGLELSQFIHRTRQKMGLLDQIGCAPHDFKAQGPIYDRFSLWGLYTREVLPKIFFKEKSNSIMFVTSEAWRYDLLSHSPLVVDDVMAVAPFNDTIVLIGQVLGSTILELNETLNDRKGSLPHYILAGEIDDKNKLFDFYTHDFNVNEVVHALKTAVPDQDYKPEATETTSTLVWLSFVRESWSCDGEMGDGEMGDDTAWISPSAPRSTPIFQDGNEMATEAWAIIMLMIVALLTGVWFLFRVFGCIWITSDDFAQLSPNEDCIEA